MYTNRGINVVYASSPLRGHLEKIGISLEFENQELKESIIEAYSLLLLS